MSRTFHPFSLPFHSFKSLHSNEICEKVKRVKRFSQKFLPEFFCRKMAVLKGNSAALSSAKKFYQNLFTFSPIPRISLPVNEIEPVKR